MQNDIMNVYSDIIECKNLTAVIKAVYSGLLLIVPLILRFSSENVLRSNLPLIRPAEIVVSVTLAFVKLALSSSLTLLVHWASSNVGTVGSSSKMVVKVPQTMIFF